MTPGQGGTPTYHEQRLGARSSGQPWTEIRLDMTEAQFQRLVLEFAAWTGWGFRYHTYDSRHSASGFPDLVLCRGRRIVIAELKSQTGKASREQRAWLDALELTPVESFLWRPSDWPDVQRTLR